MYDLNDLHTKTLNWAGDRKILEHGQPLTQLAKLMEELGELASEIVRERPNKREKAMDAVGDMFVVMTSLSHLLGFTLPEAANAAFKEIEHRTGHLTADGNFVKDEE